MEANAQSLEALRQALNKEYLCMVSHCDSAFAIWNTLTSPKLPKYVEEEYSEDESEQACYMIQGNDSLEVWALA